MLTSRQKQAIQTRYKIMTCAMELLRTKNYDDISVKEICDNASVSVGAFYHYYRSKDDIIDDGFKAFDIEIEDFINSKSFDSHTAAIYQILEQYFKVTSENGPSIVSSMFRLQLSIKDKYVISHKRYFYLKLYDIIQQGIAAGEFKSQLACEDICDWIFRTARGTIIDWCLHDASYDLVECGCRDASLIIETMLTAKNQ